MGRPISFSPPDPIRGLLQRTTQSVLEQVSNSQQGVSYDFSNFINGFLGVIFQQASLDQLKYCCLLFAVSYEEVKFTHSSLEFSKFYLQLKEASPEFMGEIRSMSAAQRKSELYELMVQFGFRNQDDDAENAPPNEVSCSP